MSLRIVILTEDEPFHAPDSFRVLLKLLPQHSVPVLAVITRFSPDGASRSPVALAVETARTYGIVASLRAAWRMFSGAVLGTPGLRSLFADYRIPVLDGVRNVNRMRPLWLIREAKPDLIISVSMHHKFGPELLAMAPCLNLHLSLLPRHRGLAPVFWALHAGDKETGVSVHLIDEKIDNGKILVQWRVPIRIRNLDLLYGELKLHGMQALAEAVRLFPDYKSAPALNTKAKPPPNGAPQRSDVRAFLAAGNRLF